VLNVSVGELESCPVILPLGTKPSLIRAWKPLHIPSARPSLSLRSFSTASFILALRKAVAKNLAEPSGSSPAENPPGNIIICDWLIAFSNSSTDSLMLAASRFLNTLTIVSAPALSNALALSYSQLVPGNTGINTVGFATLFLHTYTLPFEYTGDSTLSVSLETFVGNTPSNVSFHTLNASSILIETSSYVNLASSVTVPTLV